MRNRIFEKSYSIARYCFFACTDTISLLEELGEEAESDKTRAVSFFPYTQPVSKPITFSFTFIAVHAGLLPNKKPQQMDLEDLVKIRKITDPQNPKILKSWFDFYKGKKLVVFGHWAALNGIVKENVIGLDTGCVYGKKLTALVLSDSASSPNSSKREIVSVQAKKQYLAIE